MGTFLATLVAILAIFYLTVGLGDEEIRCIDSSCSKTKCADVPAKCKANVTNPGVYLLSPDVCNCCKYCLVNLAEGEACSVGDPSNGQHTSICGPGLTCSVDGEATDGTCQPMSTPCAQAQQDYDTRREKGYLGTMESRMTCDDDGLYATYKCIPGQSCHCLLANGTRVFGEANYNTISNYMPCTCSRKYYDAVDILGRDLHPHEHFRCTSDGNYDRIQCINEQCLCVDAEDGAPTFPDKDLIPLENITSEVMPCYTSKTPGEYYKTCEGEYMKVHKEVEARKKESGYKLVFGYTYPKCDLDGTYAAVQENKTHKYCVDKEGVPLLALDKSDATLKPLITDMDCKCARAYLVMTTSEKPECLSNGNYNPVQCRRGVCRCVDSDGSQKCTSATAACEEVDEGQALKCL